NPFGGVGGSSEKSEERTATGILKTRYIAVTDQVRRMPVAMLLTVDQQYIPDVLAAFSNYGKMRFQIAHYHWKRHHGPLPGAKPQGGTGEDEPGGGNAAGEHDRPKGGAPMGPGFAGEGDAARGPGMGPAGFGPGGMGPGAGAPAPGGVGPGGIGPGGFGPGRFGPGGFNPGQ